MNSRNGMWKVELFGFGFSCTTDRFLSDDFWGRKTESRGLFRIRFSSSCCRFGLALFDFVPNNCGFKKKNQSSNTKFQIRTPNSVSLLSSSCTTFQGIQNRDSQSSRKKLPFVNPVSGSQVTSWNFFGTAFIRHLMNRTGL